MLLDAHVHIDKYKIDSMFEIKRLCQMQDIKLLGVSMNIPSYLNILKLSDKYDFIIPSFGIHPWEAHKYCNNLEKIDEYLASSQYIGEIGLDKKFFEYASPYSDQEKVFDYILSNKATKNKLLNLHTSGAESEVLSYLEKYKHSKFIIHWYAGPLELIDKYLNLGGYFTLGVEILFSNSIVEIAKRIPIDRILLETDGPYSYSWLKGLDNNNDDMPDLLYKVAKKVSEIKGLSSKRLYQQLEYNQVKILS